MAGGHLPTTENGGRGGRGIRDEADINMQLNVRGLAGCVLQDPAVWASLTGLNNDSNKNFRPGVPRKAAVRGDAASKETDRAVEMR